MASTATGKAQSEALESASSLSAKITSASSVASAAASATAASGDASEHYVPVWGAMVVGAMGFLI